MLIDADTPYFRFTRENRVKFKMYINVNTRKYQIQNFVTVGGALPPNTPQCFCDAVQNIENAGKRQILSYK